MVPDELRHAAESYAYPLMFATVSGAHLYGFDSPDSDWDLRGVHILPATQVVGLSPLEETIETARKDRVELDLVTHDVKKFFKLMLKPNGYVLEQLLSPIVVHSTTDHDELKAISVGCLTRHHVHHYRGFAENQWRLFLNEAQPRIKPLLYTFRVLLTGIHLMRSGEIQANLNHLYSMYPLPYLPELIARKRDGAEQQTLPSADTAFYEKEFAILRERLLTEAATTRLPEENSAAPALNDMLVRIRLNGLSSW